MYTNNLIIPGYVSPCCCWLRNFNQTRKWCTVSYRHSGQLFGVAARMQVGRSYGIGLHRKVRRVTFDWRMLMVEKHSLAKSIANDTDLFVRFKWQLYPARIYSTHRVACTNYEGMKGLKPTRRPFESKCILMYYKFNSNKFRLML